MNKIKSEKTDHTCESLLHSLVSVLTVPSKLNGVKKKKQTSSYQKLIKSVGLQTTIFLWQNDIHITLAKQTVCKNLYCLDEKLHKSHETVDNNKIASFPTLNFSKIQQHMEETNLCTVISHLTHKNSPPDVWFVILGPV